jgi:hypothetical protein
MSTRSKIHDAVRKTLENRGYDNYASDAAIWEETLDDVTREILLAIWSEE